MSKDIKWRIVSQKLQQIKSYRSYDTHNTVVILHIVVTSLNFIKLIQFIKPLDFYKF